MSTTGLKWLEPVPSTFCVLIGTDITLNPFLQALIISCEQFRPWTSGVTHRTSLFWESASRQQCLPRCCIKFGAWIHQTLTQRVTAVKSMSSPGSIQELPLERIPKRLETAFLWEHTFDSIASLCNNGVYEIQFLLLHLANESGIM